MKCIYVNCKERDWLKEIFDGTKVIETRRNRCLSNLIGQRVGLVRTGCGPAKLVGECIIACEIVYGSDTAFNSDYQHHRVDAGSRFAKNHIGYELWDVHEYALEIPLSDYPIIRHGFDWCEVNNLPNYVKYKEDQMTFRMDKTAADTLIIELAKELDYWLYEIDHDALLARKDMLLAIADLYDALGHEDAEDIRYRVAEVEKGYKQRNPHGKVVGYRQDPWHDVTIYEDGYEERFYIGE